VGQISEGSLQELFQKLFKAEEIIKERGSNRGLETQRAKYYSKPIVSSRTFSHTQQDSKGNSKCKKQEFCVNTCSQIF